MDEESLCGTLLFTRDVWVNVVEELSVEVPDETKYYQRKFFQGDEFRFDSSETVDINATHRMIFQASKMLRSGRLVVGIFPPLGSYILINTEPRRLPPRHDADINVVELNRIIEEINKKKR